MPNPKSTNANNIKTGINTTLKTVIWFGKISTLVQGEKAKDDIIEKIEYADSLGVDTIIVGRGGGSIEDLWNFNEEAVVRAIYDC